MKKQSLITVALGCLFIFCTITTICFSQTKNVYHNQEGHFSFIIPDCWEQIPQGIINNLNNEASKEHSGWGCDTGFKKAKTVYPYSYITIHKSGRLTEKQIESVVSDNSIENKEQNIINDYAKSFPSRRISGLEQGKFIYDRERNMCLQKMMVKKGDKNIIGITICFFSNYGDVTVGFTSLDEEFNNDSNDLQIIMDSFKFDKGYEY